MSEPVLIAIQHIGPVATHNLMCWICGEKKAVYNMRPVWAFEPCGQCNTLIGGRLKRVRQWRWPLRRSIAEGGDQP